MSVQAIRYFLPLTFILVFLVYLQAADGPYLVDDMSNLVNNDKLIITEFSFETIKEAALSSPASRFYRPVSMLTFAANYSLAGDKSPFPVKLTNIILHLVIGFGIFILTRRLFPYLMHGTAGTDKYAVNIVSLLTTLLWLSHPLFVSTVLYPVQRMAMLSAFFVIYGCIIYLYLRERIISENRGHTTLLFIIPTITITGFFAKENAFLLPGFMLLIEYYCFNFSLPPRAPAYFRTALKSFLWIPVLFVFLYLTYIYIAQSGEALSNYPFSINERVLTQFRILWHYLGWLTFLNPEPLGIYHDDIPLSTGLTQPWTTLLSILAWLILLPAAFFLNRYSKIFSFGLLWFLWGHSIESTVLPLGIIFEHRNYLPGYGPLLALAGLMGMFLQGRDRKPAIAYSLILLFLVLPNLLLHERVQRWTDQQSLAIWLLDKHPDSVHALAVSANYLSAIGDTRHAMQALDRARSLSPDDTAVLFNRIRILCEKHPGQKFDSRLIQHIRSITVDAITSNSRMYFNFVVNNCSESTINHDPLLELYNRFSRSQDRSIAALSFYGMGKIHLYHEDYEEAASAWEKATETSPDAHVLIPGIRKLRETLDEENPEGNNDNPAINRP